MSPDGKEPGAIWQGPEKSGRGRSFDQEQQNSSPSFSQQQQEEVQWRTPVALEQEDEVDTESEEVEPPAPGLLRQFRQYFALLVVPLLFGALTCLFVLPLVATGRVPVPPTDLWLVTLVIILIVIAQAAAIYYAGENTGLWILATVGGFFLFLLAGCFVIFGLMPGLTLLVILAVISVALGRLCVRFVSQGYVDLVYTFGKYGRTLYPGFNVLLPWEKVRQHLYVEEIQWLCPAQRVQMSRDEDLMLRAIISYRLLPEDAHLAANQIDRWEDRLRELFKTAIQSIATTFTPDDFIAWPHGLHQGTAEATPRWERVNRYLLQYMQDRVALWGVQINWVHIRDITLTPHNAFVAAPEPLNDAPTLENEAPALPKEASMPREPEPEQPAPARPAMSDNAAAPLTGPIKEEALRKAYKEVQDGHVTDPETIRSLAMKFDAIARDPQLSQTVSFDAARAALNLYRQAIRYEEQFGERSIYDDVTKPDWAARPATDENLMAGG
jgi:hypothetical protein